jgi:hypothetical protein
MVAQPAQYRWSAYLALGGDPARQAAAYAELCKRPVEANELEEIRKATRSGYPLGSKRRPRGRPRAVTPENGDCHHLDFDFEKW